MQNFQTLAHPLLGEFGCGCSSFSCCCCYHRKTKSTPKLVWDGSLTINQLGLPPCNISEKRTGVRERERDREKGGGGDIQFNLFSHI
jgi:hypothetical protein